MIINSPMSSLCGCCLCVCVCVCVWIPLQAYWPSRQKHSTCNTTIQHLVKIANQNPQLMDPHEGIYPGEKSKFLPFLHTHTTSHTSPYRPELFENQWQGPHVLHPLGPSSCFSYLLVCLYCLKCLRFLFSVSVVAVSVCLCADCLHWMNDELMAQHHLWWTWEFTHFGHIEPSLFQLATTFCPVLVLGLCVPLCVWWLIASLGEWLAHDWKKERHEFACIQLMDSNLIILKSQNSPITMLCFL